MKKRPRCQGRLETERLDQPPRTFTARAATSSTAPTEIMASSAMSVFVFRVSGIASVGLNAIPFVKATYV